MNEPTLEPCPFCGNDPVVKKLDHGYWDRCIMCTVCCCKTGEYSSGNAGHMAAMREAWNRRAPVSAPALDARKEPEVCDVVGCLEPAERVMYLNGVRGRMCIGHEKRFAAEDRASRDGRQGEWQPMATAPKGGGAKLVTDPNWIEPPHILLLFDKGKTAVGHWDWYYAEGGSGHEARYGEHGAWIEPVSGERVILHYDPPIAWMSPPPYAPAATAEQGGEAL